MLPPSSSPSGAIVPYRPAAYYFRQALRGAETRERAVAVGLAVCRELEQLHTWLAGEGLVVPRWILDPGEVEPR